MAMGDRGQAFEAGIAEDLAGPFTDLAGGRSREGTVEGIDLGQEADIGIGIAARKGLGGCTPSIPDRAGVEELADQAGDLGPGEAGDLLQVASYQTLVGPAQACVPETTQLTGDPAIDGIPGEGFEAERLSALEEGQASLRSRERFWDIQVPKIDSIFDNSLVPRPSWSPGVPPQHRKLVAATHRPPI